MTKLIDKIPEDLLRQYHAYELTSGQLAARTGFHEASIRRAIKRAPRPAKPKNKTDLLTARKAYRRTIAHLSPSEIQKIIPVSLSTANRIRRLRKEPNA